VHFLHAFGQAVFNGFQIDFGTVPEQLDVGILKLSHTLVGLDVPVFTCQIQNALIQFVQFEFVVVAQHVQVLDGFVDVHVLSLYTLGYFANICFE